NAQAELTYYLTPNPGAGEPGAVTLLLSTITAGYVRDFQNTFLANVYTSNKGYLKFNYFFGPRAVIQIGGEFEDLEYAQPFVNAGPGVAPVPAIGPNGAPLGPFTDYRVGAVLFGEYRLLETLGINATVKYDQMISDTLIGQGAAPPPGGGPVPPGG